ncbi:MAG TPA: hypothetical protein VMN57_10045 [Anaerolineales bacterium]|nr:hypothetical protein [Anaerolineales bacterium]
MIPMVLLDIHSHGAMPGASDEILAVIFLIFAALAGWHLIRG